MLIVTTQVSSPLAYTRDSLTKSCSRTRLDPGARRQHPWIAQVVNVVCSDCS